MKSERATGINAVELKGAGARGGGKWTNYNVAFDYGEQLTSSPRFNDELVEVQSGIVVAALLGTRGMHTPRFCGPAFVRINVNINISSALGNTAS